MNIKNLSPGSLKDLHQLIKECLAADDAALGPKPYGVREYPDWRKQADGFEAEMITRGIPFDPIGWVAVAAPDSN